MNVLIVYLVWKLGWNRKWYIGNCYLTCNEFCSVWTKSVNEKATYVGTIIYIVESFVGVNM